MQPRAKGQKRTRGRTSVHVAHALPTGKWSTRSSLVNCYISVSQVFGDRISGIIQKCVYLARLLRLKSKYFIPYYQYLPSLTCVTFPLASKQQQHNCQFGVKFKLSFSLDCSSTGSLGLQRKCCFLMSYENIIRCALWLNEMYTFLTQYHEKRRLCYFVSQCVMQWLSTLEVSVNKIVIGSVQSAVLDTFLGV